MARACTICRHPQRQVIELKRRGGETLRGLASEWGVHKDALARHFRHGGIGEREEIRRTSCGHCRGNVHVPETCRWCQQPLCGDCWEVNKRVIPGPCAAWYDLMALAAGVSVEEFIATLGVGAPADDPSIPVEAVALLSRYEFPQDGSGRKAVRRE